MVVELKHTKHFRKVFATYIFTENCTKIYSFKLFYLLKLKVKQNLQKKFRTKTGATQDLVHLLSAKRQERSESGSVSRFRGRIVRLPPWRG